MRPCPKELLLIGATIVASLSGCFTGPKAPITYLGYSDLNYYKEVATKVDYPLRPAADNPDAVASLEPPRIRYPRKDQLWDMPLAEAVQIALKNNKIIRTRDQFLSPRNPTINTPDQSPSVFDPAVQETGVLFGQRGVEAALSDFDAQLTTSMTWGRNEQVINNAFLAGGLPAGDTLVQETANFRARLDKTFADSSQFSVIHNMDYTQSNQPGQLFPSVYTGFLRAEYRRPLLAGAGTDYTRIAGPINKNQVGVGQGVVISRINNDIAIADFEASVQNLVRDVQNSYWELSLAYRSYDAQVISWRSALRTWRIIHSKALGGMEGGGAADEAQARDNLFDSQGRAEDALGNVYTTEGQFRRLLGLTVNDGRIIRPSDEPTVAEFIPDWHMAIAEGITRRPEVRKQKWNIKSLEYQMAAAHSLTRPRVDFVAGYQVNAFGDVLLGGSDNGGTPQQRLHSAYDTLEDNRQTGWNLGFEASIPIGFRNAHTQVRNFEVRLARARAALSTQELEVTHEIRNAYQTLDRSYTVAQAAFNRRMAAEERVRAYEAQWELRPATVDPLLRAQQNLAQAEISFFQSVVQYNQAITDFYFRTGTILDENNIVLSEDVWDPRAYTDSLRRAWARSHAADNPCLRTAPAEFVVPNTRGRGILPVAGSPIPLVPGRATNSSPTPADPQPVNPPTVNPAPKAQPRGNEGQPAGPLPSPPNQTPSGIPQAQASVVTTAQSGAADFGLPPTTGNTNAVLRVSGVVPAATGPRPAEPALFQPPASMKPVPLPTNPGPSFEAPVSSPSESAWSTPNVRPGQSSGAADDGFPTGDGERYAMPVNRVGP